MNGRCWRCMAGILLAVVMMSLPAMASPDIWRYEWPRTDFSRHAVPLDEFQSGGPPKDGIPSIDHPIFRSMMEVHELAGREPVITLKIGEDVRIYPLRVLTWHEIVNDTVGGVPVAVTYCPLCNAAIVFERRLGNRVLDFGTTGKLRHSDLVMYDRQTESWWQQFTGEAMVGTLVGQKLRMVPALIESWDTASAREPAAKVLIPSDPSARPYGRNPYVGYDSLLAPMFFRGPLPDKVPAMAYVVAVESVAWTLEMLREAGRVEHGNLVLSWTARTASALDTGLIAEGRDVGSVRAMRRQADGTFRDVVHHLTFAFVFFAFTPDGSLFTKSGAISWSGGSESDGTPRPARPR